MARQARTLPARRRRESSGEESMLIRSAESLGRMIGLLQRQIDKARRDSINTRTIPPGSHNGNESPKSRRSQEEANDRRPRRAKARASTAKRSTKSTRSKASDTASGTRRSSAHK